MGTHGTDDTAIAYGGELAGDHPGFQDGAYRARRATIADAAIHYRRGHRVPTAPYSDDEHEVWALCRRELALRHERYAAQDVLRSSEQLALPTDHVPQLDEVSARLHPLTGFRYEPVPGLVSPRVFYGALGEGWFMSTQYIRHHSVPSYTPEPDVVHEVIGHATQLSVPAFADCYRRFGAAASRVRADDAVQLLSRIFWFTVEFGVVYEAGELRAYGAGILSSFGELDTFQAAEIRPFDPWAMGTVPYDITRYQPVLFAAPSMPELVEELSAFLDGYDDEAYERNAPIVTGR